MKTRVWFKSGFLYLILALFLIVLWRSEIEPASLSVDDLPKPPDAAVLELVSAGDKELLSRLIIIWLQQYDAQAGQYIAYQRLNYQLIVDWLERLIELNPESDYPLLLATRVYAKVKDNKRRKMMLEFTFRQFEKNPAKNWRWLSEAVVQAKYKLKDLDLALKYAQALSQSKAENIPRWARDSRLHVMKDRGEIEELRLIIGGMLVNGDISDPNEIEYLDNYLKKLEKEPVNVKNR